MTDPVLQNFDNHTFVSKPWITAALLLLAGTLAAGVGTILVNSAMGSYLVGGGVVLNGLGSLVALVLIRSYALKLQDRIIRTEMRVRLERILPAGDRERIEDLTIKQLIGLRFAGDAEMPELLRRVLDENIQDPTPIKRMVQDWQGDYHRV